MIKVPAEVEAEILRLFVVEHWPVGTIASQLQLHHEVVRRVIDERPKAEPSGPTRTKMIDEYETFVRQTLEKYPKLASSRLYGMVRDRGYSGSESNFRKQVARLRPSKQPEPFLRLRKLVAEEAQVDWAHFGSMEAEQTTCKLYAFVMTLSHSRAVWLQFFFDMKMASFLQGHIEAFHYFEGTPRVLLYDNLKSAVTERDGRHIRFNETLVAFASHYGFEPRAAAPARGNEKGIVERTIRYVRDNFFAARQLKSLEKLNEEARSWAENTALQRKWPDDDTRSVAVVFAHEKTKLRPLPNDDFPAYDRQPVRIGKSPWVRFGRNDYSVPPKYVRCDAIVLSDHKTVRVLVEGKLIAEHKRSFGRHMSFENPEHTAALLEIKKRALRPTLSRRLIAEAPGTEKLLVNAAERGQNISHIIQALSRLLSEYGADALDRAVELAVKEDRISPMVVKRILEVEAEKSGKQPPLPVILPRKELELLSVRRPNLKVYDEEE